MKWPTFSKEQHPGVDIVGDTITRMTDAALPRAAAEHRSLEKAKAETAARARAEEKSIRAIGLTPEDLNVVYADRLAQKVTRG